MRLSVLRRNSWLFHCCFIFIFIKWFNTTYLVFLFLLYVFRVASRNMIALFMLCVAEKPKEILLYLLQSYYHKQYSTQNMLYYVCRQHCTPIHMSLLCLELNCYDYELIVNLKDLTVCGLHNIKFCNCIFCRSSIWSLMLTFVQLNARQVI